MRKAGITFWSTLQGYFSGIAGILAPLVCVWGLGFGAGSLGYFTSSGFKVWGLGFMVWGLGFGAIGSLSGTAGSSAPPACVGLLGFRVWGFGFGF